MTKKVLQPCPQWWLVASLTLDPQPGDSMNVLGVVMAPTREEALDLCQADVNDFYQERHENNQDTDDLEVVVFPYLPLTVEQDITWRVSI